MSLNIIFMGTPDFAVPSLAEIISAGHNVICVYTQPPRRAGRGKQLRQSPIHQFCDLMNLPVKTPEDFRDADTLEDMEALKADVACVVAYGQILPQRALDAPPYGCLNLHGSLLPRWRGAAPIQRAIMAGNARTGVQIMQMAKGLDTGDILLSESVDILGQDTAQSLSLRLSQIGAQMWPRTLAALERDALTPTPQQGEPCYAKKIDKAEARIDWSQSARKLDCHIRGLSPFPGAWCEIDGKRIKVHLAQVEDRPIKTARKETAKPGDVLDEALLIACGETTALRLSQVQPAGKGKMSAQDFLRARKIAPGTRLS